MARDLRQIRGEKENPFHVELMEEFQVKKKMEFVQGEKGAQHVVIDHNGTPVAESRFMRIKNVDEEKFVKIFIGKINVMWDMIPPATRVYTYILYNLPIKSTEIYFDFDDILSFTKYKSLTSIWKGINWLIDNNFIAKSYKPNFFWINPTMFFNGDRVAFVDMIVKEKKGQDTKELT